MFQLTDRATTVVVLVKRKAKPPRLDRIFQKYNPTVYFVTFNTHLRRRILASEAVQRAFVAYCKRAAQHDIGVGRFVIMPDHVHLFVSFGIGAQLTLGEWIKGLKRWLDAALRIRAVQPVGRVGQRLRSFWQPGFHDHVLRNDESYSGKWNYVRENPVRAGLVPHADEWPYAGEIVVIDRV
ncbi:MAG TPA: transposase [Chthoniobacterales bacterium]|nr:transposase [Chthoniobacterales bacterium]